MAYTSQGLIQAADYNGFASTTSGANVNNVWSTGSTDSGWGQTALATVSTSATTGGIASVTLATAGVLTVTSGTYAVGQQIEVTGTFSAGSISGYTTGTRYYIIAVNSATSITISATPSGSAVTSTAGTATPGATFTITGPASFVTATQWASLVNTISSMASQTGTTITSRVAPVAGNTIQILAALNTDLTNITTNRQNAVANGTQFTGWTGTNSKTTATQGSPLGQPWTITFTNTVTWASADAARYFFNAGGRIKIDVSKTATGATGDPEWNDLANTLCGDIFITGGTATQTIAGASYTGTTKVGGTGAPNILLTTTGWYDLPAGGLIQTVYKQFADTAPYTSNFIQHQLQKNAASTTLTIITLWSCSDGDPITGGTAASGATPGTAPTTIVTYFPPSTTYLSASWGTPTIAATTA
jgi:hypothetical protein